ncbi:MAG TPA: FG-GAP-like repeat-containing protein [Planctomycetota bacterium]|nr:FG-GAP-like repeat-containing protein [Planctomycetota bacterium]
MIAALPGQISVQSVQPTGHRTDVPVGAPIAITFAEPVSRASVHARSLRVFGRWSGVATGTISFADGDRTVVFTPSRPFFCGETVTVYLSQAVTAASGNRLTGGYTWSFWTAPARGSRNLVLERTIPVRRTGEGGIRVYGAYAGDLDRDGAPDLSVPCEDSNDLRVLGNDGCGNYTSPVPFGLPSNARPSTNEGHDFDGDGFIDLAVGNILSGTISVFLGDGTGGYRAPQHYPSGAQTRGIAVLDADGDGDIDLVAANRSGNNLTYFANRGDGTFDAPVAFDGGGSGETAIAAADANGDGIADLFVGCFNSGTVTLLLGDGAGGFTLSSSVPVTGNPWMIAIGDVDRDGAVDAVVCTSSQPRVALVRGDGTGGLLPAVDYPTGAFPIAVDLGDIDGDGALDFVASNFQGTTFDVYWNDGNGGFGGRLTLNAPRAGSCALVVDDDRDGDLDVLGIDELADVILLFRQTETWPAGVERGACTARLRLDQRARAAGFGAVPPHPVTAGATLFVGVSGPAAQPFGLFAGVALTPGPALPFGIVNLAPAPVVVLPGGATDAAGEALVALPMPGGVPGAALAFQAAVLDPAHPAALHTSNPEVAALQ